MEAEILSRQDIEYRTIPAAGLHGVGMKNLPGNLIQLIRGYLKAGQILRQYQPNVMFFTGGYLAVPAAYAGRSVPSLVFIPDIEPGLAIKTIANLSSRIAIAVDQTRAFTPAGKRVVETGYPVRKGLLQWTRLQALESLTLDPGLPVLLVFGGSSGARSINRSVAAILPELLKEMQIVHISGKLDWEEMVANQARLSQKEQENYRLYAFLHEEMGAALRVADLVVSRSGASILGEYPAFGLPAILVPYPHAWQYQKTNAKYLADRGAAVIIQDGDLGNELLIKIQSLIRDQESLSMMGSAMKKLSKPNAALDIAKQLMILAGDAEGGSIL
jgi:UDP-N-acetylglucosamine--N-acetylmuramyl-(pentapeptide) pyrophosphoryl-undecaprenol N-acetylglucosamine transferase